MAEKKGAQVEVESVDDKHSSGKRHGGLDVKAVVQKCQKKLMTSMANRKNVRPFLTDNANAFLDTLYRLLKEVTGSKKVAEKCVKNMIKLAIKISFLVREGSDKLSADEIRMASDMRMRLKRTTLTLISFSRVEFSYDQRYLTSHLEEVRTLGVRLLEGHMTAKTVSRLNYVFDTLASGTFLDAIFRSTKNTVDRSGDPLRGAPPASNATAKPERERGKENAPAGDAASDNPHRDRLNELVTHLEALLDEGLV